MNRKIHHVVQDANGWSVKEEGSSLPILNTRTRVEAIRIGHVISLRQGSELKIEERDESPSTTNDFDYQLVLSK